MKWEIVQGSAVESLLQRRGKLSEAQLFGAALSDKIAEHSSPEVAEEFRRNFRQLKREQREKTRCRGIVNAAMSSLDALVASGKVSRDCARVLTNESWTLSQLDKNPENVAIQTDMGVNVSRESGIEQYHRRNALYQSGALALTKVTDEMMLSQRFSSSTPAAKDSGTGYSMVENSGKVGSVSQNASAEFGASPVYQRGFLFKPISDSTGKVAVLMPPSLTGKVKSVSLKSNDSIESGSYGGIGNGFREHFRFKWPGSSYSANLSVVVMLSDGTIHNVRIPNPGLRYEVR
jgi:hypothetical protein